jgi:penicillin G amidase
MPVLRNPARLPWWTCCARAGTCAGALALAAVQPALAQKTGASQPIQSETIVVPGLAAPARILIDRWGVPHIAAAGVDDVFFVQGFNAARDRLFQIDLWRRRGLGRLASVFGSSYVEQDRAARLFLYRGDMAAEWAAYSPDAQRIATRFVAGINAYIDLVAGDVARLPFEFRHFGYAPEKWQPEDVVRIRSHGLAQNLGSEFSRSYITCHSDLKSDEVRVRLSPPWQTRVPEGLDPCVPVDVLRVYGLATQGLVVNGPEIRRSAVDGDQRLAMVDGLPPTEGSNAWAISPARSATGRPILASDPHRSYAAPSLRYIVHLQAPGLNLIGGGEPALPGVSIGHNGALAFGLTVFAIDQEDLYIYETNPKRPREYRYRGRWEKMRRVTESIEVRGSAPVKTDLLFTRHGPVIHAEAAKHRAYAVRSVWFEPGTAPYFGSVATMHARSVAEFRRGMANWGTPAENLLVADVNGDIGWVAGGRAPVRLNWDGLLPVPGDGRYEWAGFWPGHLLPSAINPKRGWLASSNEQNLPADYPFRERKLGFEWPDNARYQRVVERLEAVPKLSIEDSMRLQNDILSVPARRMQAVLRATPLRDSRARSAASLLLGWNLVESADSGAAALFEVWWTRYLGPLLKQTLLSHAASRMIRTADTELLLEWMETTGARVGAAGPAPRDEVLEQSLAMAWLDMQRLAGPDPATWQWGQLHHTLFAHPLAPAVDEGTRARLNVGPYAKHGGTDTVNVSAYDPTNFRQLGGPSFRVVMDVGHWDNSRAMNTPGQSGDPDSPHYRDLAPMWLKGDYFPLLYSQAAVEAAAVRRIDLVPAAPKRSAR